MNLQSWKELIEVIGFVAIVASLIFVGIELRQSRAIAIADGNLSNAEIQIESNNAISQYSSIWIRGNAGEALAANEAAIFNNLVKNAAIHSFMEYARLDQVEFSEAAESVTGQFAVFLFQNPGAREAWQQSEDFFAEHFESPGTKAVWRDEVLAKLTILDGGSAQ